MRLKLLVVQLTILWLKPEDCCLPFSQDEPRSVDFLFDTPKGIKADNFIIEDEKFKPIPFKL
ncbi:MAG: hypothetical protein V7K35_03715 [Nostoc sp.]|uniref:hypothetical protein n=1 Tax=Nostoc sp. TaxID=1180 RepID=UPI002FF9A3D3